jgi:hypothetical protein
MPQALVLLHTSSSRLLHHEAAAQQEGGARAGSSHHSSSPRAAQVSGAVRQVARLLQLSYIDYEAMSVGLPGAAGAGGEQGGGATAASRLQGRDSGGGAGGAGAAHELPWQGLNLLLALFDRQWRCNQLPVIDEAAMLQM